MNKNEHILKLLKQADLVRTLEYFNRPEAPSRPKGGEQFPNKECLEDSIRCVKAIIEDLVLTKDLVNVVSDNDVVPPNWYDNKPFMSVRAWGQREYDLGMQVGREEGKALTVSKLKEKAAELFVKGKDEEARRLRDIANGL